MASVVPPSSADKAADLLQQLSMDSQTKTLEAHEPTKKFASVGSLNMINGMAKPFERSTTPIQDFANVSTYYPPQAYPSNAYYYGDYDGPLNEWNDYGYMNHDLSHRQHGLNQRSPTSGTVFAGRSHPNNHMYDQFGNAYRPGCGFGLNYYSSQASWNSWQTVAGKYLPKGHSYGIDRDQLYELSRGPRINSLKYRLALGSSKLAVEGQDLSVNQSKDEKNLSHSEKLNYNQEDFPKHYSDAKFFVIKSYSEDDVHKSIKYNVWASTPSGNKKLDAAYQDAQGKPGSCPVFLLFSVNSSGQFVGMAEMAGLVDFNKTVDFWQQEKWTGSFPVKWHIVKDIPNNLLKHIKLENNDNKPVTNSRDTQEVKLDQGIEVLKIFKLHPSKTSILDDFEFYEVRQNTMKERKAKRQQFPKQAKGSYDAGDEKSLKSSDAFTVMPAVAPASNGELKPDGDCVAHIAGMACMEKGEIPKVAVDAC